MDAVDTKRGDVDAKQAGLSRVSAVLPTTAVEELREKAARKGDNLTQGLKAAINTKVFLDEEVNNGGTILVKRRDGSTVELKLP